VPDERLARIEELYTAKLPQFVRVCVAILRDEERARDAVQEGFARAIRARKSFRGEGSLEAWVWRAVVNAALTQRRSDERRIRAAQVATEPQAHAEPQDSHLWDAVARLPERQRLALFLRYFADLEYRTIGQALGVRTGTVSATLNAAHRALRESLERVDA
jgi:RNA polymerase sigma factor (sigma-70 family)